MKTKLYNQKKGMKEPLTMRHAFPLSDKANEWGMVRKENSPAYTRITLNVKLSTRIMKSMMAFFALFLIVPGILNKSFAQTPTVNTPSNQMVCNGATTAAVNFTGTVKGTVYSWTNDNPSIGLAVSGTGNIAPFTAINTTNAPVTATVTVTPTVSSSGFAYITQGSSVSVINTATNTVVETIPLGGFNGGSYGVAVSPDGSRVYTGNHSSDNMSVINTATNTVVATIPIGLNPIGISVSPDGSRVYVANNASTTVSVINTSTNTVEATIPVGSFPNGVAVSPDGSRLYVVNAGWFDNMFVINTSTNTVLDTIPVGNDPFGVSVSPDGSCVYVTGSTNTVSLINTATKIVDATIPVGSSPRGISVSPDGSRVYVANFSSNNVSVINTATKTVVATIPVGLNPVGVSCSYDGSQVYVANSKSNNVSVINTVNNTVVATIPVSSSPQAFGNFVSGGSAIVCTGLPKTFTITVNPILTNLIIEENFVTVTRLFAYPNPFTNKINFNLLSAHDTHALLEMYDLSGRKVAVVLDGEIKGNELYNIEYVPAMNVVSGMMLYRLIDDQNVYIGKVMYQLK